MTRKTLLVSIALLVLILGILVRKLHLEVIEITEKEKCPACYGVSICKDIDDGMLSLEYADFYSSFNNLFGMKNVFYGKYKDEKVIMKKLAHKSELENFDKIICSHPEFHELCFQHVKLENVSKTDFFKLILLELSNSNITDPNNKIRLCPSTVNFQTLFENVKMENTSRIEDFYKFVWTLVKINPEPLLLQILSAENGWPTPKYFGACGRLIVEEFVSFSLPDFLDEPWIRRAKVASSLLDAAYQFTFKNAKFSFYLTDVSIDNIAINYQDEVIFIDLENIIIVDKEPPEKITKKIVTWKDVYSNNIEIDCTDCFIFSPMDICNHKISDHNYYAICQHILYQGEGTDENIQGFLHSPPDNILKQYPNFLHLLQQCSKPQNTFDSRIDFGIQLKKLLDSIIKKDV